MSGDPMKDLRAEVACLLAEAEVEYAAMQRPYGPDGLRTAERVGTLRTVLVLFDAQPVDRDGKRVVTLRLTDEQLVLLSATVAIDVEEAEQVMADPDLADQHRDHWRGVLAERRAILAEIDAQGAKS